MVFRTRASSKERHWDGFEAVLYEASAGVSEQQFIRHNVSMQIGRPVLVTACCNNERLRRLQIPGDVKIVPPGVTRVWEAESATTKLSMYLSPTLMLSTAHEMGVNWDLASIPPRMHVRDPRIEHIGWAVKAELESPEPLGRVYGDSLGVALAAHLLRAYAPAHGPRLDGTISRRRLTRVFNYIRANIGGNLSLSELARVAGVGPSHFKTLFKNTVGVPAHQYVIRRRVDHATELLQCDAALLADVALQAGFADQSHMARCMKRILGVTPSDLRK